MSSSSLAADETMPFGGILATPGRRSLAAAAILVVAALALAPSTYDTGGGGATSLFASGFVVPSLPSAFRRHGAVGGAASFSHISPKLPQIRSEPATLLSASVVEESTEATVAKSGDEIGVAANLGATDGDAAGAGAAAPAASAEVNGDAAVNGVVVPANGEAVAAPPTKTDGPKTEADFGADTPDVPLPTSAGGYCHTKASKAKISAANKGKTPWNKGKGRSEEVKRRIADGVRRRNRERFLAKLEDMGVTEEEYELQKKEERRRKDAERRARKTENGGYRPTEETKAKISAVLKEKWANGEVKKRKPSTGARRKGFKHTEETKQKIRESLKKRWATDPEYRAKKVNSAKAQNSSKDSRERIADTLRKKWEDPEFRAYMMERMATRKKSSAVVDDEHRRKISQAMKKKWKDASYRAKAVKGMKKHMAENPRPKRPMSRRKVPGPKEETAEERVQVGDSGIFAVTAAAPTRRRRKSSKTTRGKVANGATGAAPKRKKRKKKAVTAKSDDVVGGGGAASLEAMMPLTKPKSKPDEVADEEPIDMSDGSLDRLRLERRDLYDLLYGDEAGEASHFATESAFYDSKGQAKGAKKSTKKKVPKSVPKSKKTALEMVGAPLSAPSAAGSSSSAFSWDEDDEDDENLDNFDPYGLDDF